MTDPKKDYDALADWAENNMTLPANSTTAKRGADAAAAGRDLLTRSAGRPSLSLAGSTSPRRQVRLPADVSRDLDQLAEQDHVKASVLMREAITDYVRSRSAHTG